MNWREHAEAASGIANTPGDEVTESRPCYLDDPSLSYYCNWRTILGENEVIDINPHLTDAELAELKELLKGSYGALVWSHDEAGCGYIVEFDDGQHFRVVMHPRAALEMLRKKVKDARTD
jgi:hypothetical protein